jgi:hypothetical protein
LLLRHVDGFPFTLFLLCSLELIRKCLKLPIPSSSTLSHHGLSPLAGRPLDVPVIFVSPTHVGRCDSELDLRQPRVELSDLIPKLSAHWSQGDIEFASQKSQWCVWQCGLVHQQVVCGKTAERLRVNRAGLYIGYLRGEWHKINLSVLSHSLSSNPEGSLYHKFSRCLTNLPIQLEAVW